MRVFWRLFSKLMAKKDVFFNASAITFNLLICAIPFVLLLISIFGYVLSYEDAFQEIVRFGRELFPSFQYESSEGAVIAGPVTIEQMLRPLVKNRRVFGIVGFGILIFFTQGLFTTIKHVIFDIFEIESHRHPVMELVYNFFAISLVGSVFVFFSMSISILSILTVHDIDLPFTDLVLRLSMVMELVNLLLPFFFTLFLFYVIYRFTSEKRVSAKVSFIGALVYTVLFEIARAGVGLYLDYAIQAYEYFYQGYTILVVIFIWAFYLAALFVVSTVFARAYQDSFTKETPRTDANPYTMLS